MLVAVTNCVSHGGAFFFRKPREARPIECSLLDLHEIAAETGISVDEVICGLGDFGSADRLMGFSAALAEPINAREILRFDPDLTPRMAREPLFAKEPIPDFPVGATRIFPDEPEEVFVATESGPPDAEEILFEPTETTQPAATIETMKPAVTIEVAENASIIESAEAAVTIEAAPPAVTIAASENVAIIEATEPAATVEVAENAAIIETAEAAVTIEAAAIDEAAENVSIVGTAAEAEPPATEEKKAQPAIAEPESTETPKAAFPAARPARADALRIPHLDLEALRRISTVRVEAAEPEDDGEDEPLMDLTVPEGYAVRTTTENIVWPWETREDLTLKEALEALDDHLLTSLTEEVVSCTISGEMGEGGIKSLCETYGRAKEQIYSAIQHESRRRITRMNAKPHAASAIGSGATMELAMRMAKEFLNDEMGKAKATRFQSTIPSDDGNYYIFQKHRIEDEDSVDFPNERVYYRETGDGWAISVGY